MFLNVVLSSGQSEPWRKSGLDELPRTADIGGILQHGLNGSDKRRRFSRDQRVRVKKLPEHNTTHCAFQAKFKA